MKRFAFVLLILAVTVGGCTATRATRGNFITPDVAEKLPPGATQMQVLQTLGTPTAKAMFDDKIWYYVGEQTEQKAFYRPDTTARSVYELHFSAEGILTSFEKKDDAAVDVALSDRVTPTHGHSMTAVQQILGNVGRFNGAEGSGAPRVPGT